MTETQSQLKELARQFAKNEFSAGVSRTFFQKCFDSGLLNLKSQCENFIDIAIIVEEFAQTCPGITYALVQNDLCPISIPSSDKFQLYSFCDDTSLVANAQLVDYFIVPHKNKFHKIPNSGIFFKKINTLGFNDANFCTVQFEKIENFETVDYNEVHRDLYLSAISIGISVAALAMAKTYADERHQFGKPISQFEEIQSIFHTIELEIKAARLLLWSGDFQNARQFTRSRFVQHAIDAVQVFGGYGFSKEYPVEKLMRDAKTVEVI